MKTTPQEIMSKGRAMYLEIRAAQRSRSIHALKGKAGIGNVQPASQPWRRGINPRAKGFTLDVAGIERRIANRRAEKTGNYGIT